MQVLNAKGMKLVEIYAITPTNRMSPAIIMLKKASFLYNFDSEF